MNNTTKRSVLISTLFSITFCFAQTPDNWHLLDQKKDGYPGISLDKAYRLLEENNKTSNTVIVAVLDSGLDIEHEDLKENLWVNEGEIPNNGIDDDNNGYIDDVNGWNFIGNSAGESMMYETMEITRLIQSYEEKFKGKTKFDISKEDRAEYTRYLELKLLFENKVEKEKKSLQRYQLDKMNFDSFIPAVLEGIGKESFSKKELKRYRAKGKEARIAKSRFIKTVDKYRIEPNDLLAYFYELDEMIERKEVKVKYKYNLSYNGREIMDDSINNIEEKYYGNNDLTKRSEHGTHVSGIIAASRDNEFPAQGIADNVKIMTIRAVPSGDERDKDIANGIMYAVDNGAQIINMSFGKDYSPEQFAVDKAIRYAEERDVLIIHAAGNEKTNTDRYYRYPSPLSAENDVAQNWIEVGASSTTSDNNLVARFSNYGKTNVDIFAPGVDILSTTPENTYEQLNGTSMATPVVTGIAALLKSYFPYLSAQEIKKIILTSGVEYQNISKIPGESENMLFTEFSKTGKVVNAYEAIKYALELENENTNLAN